MMLRKIISGGQTGADQGALMAAVELGLETGGWIPQGWRTEKGREEWLSRMGLIQTPEFTYPKRTEHNVKAADATFLFGNAKSPGCKLTLNLCRDYGKPYLVVPWSVGKPQPSDVGFLHWLKEDPDL